MASTSLVSRITKFPQGLVQYIKESYNELRKVSWPSRQATIQYTAAVAIGCIVLGALVGGVDFLLTLAIQKIIL